MAVDFGNKRYPEVILSQGTADELKFEDSFFDIVILGFCMYQVDRKLIAKIIEEVDRVLKQEGLLVITDFETPLSYKRRNIHTVAAPTFKCDYAKMFCNSLGYSLIEKRMFSQEQECFSKDVQERISTQILYKEPETNLYMEE